jgi:transcriptional regulator with XRE-family HTH domain
VIAYSLIKQSRLRAELSQLELARRLGIAQSTVARWETGAMEPSFANVVKAVRACGLDLELRITERDEQLEGLVRAYVEMTPAERLAQNVHLVDFFETARARKAASHG